MTSLNREEGDEGVLGEDKENQGRPRWKEFGRGLDLQTGGEGFEHSATAPQTTKALRTKPANPPASPLYHKSLTSRSTEKTFFPPSSPAERLKYSPSKCSVKQSGIVKSYAANTNQGIVRTYNEDRVSIILNILKPASRAGEIWPKCSFFGVYDGHGGCACADYLRDNLHQFVIQESSFPSNPREALRRGFENAENYFLEQVNSKSKDSVVERSGSCAIVALVVGDMCYVANVGDSRAVLSGDGGRRLFPLSTDHKPSLESEQHRIISAGGRIYQSQITQTRTVNEQQVTENLLGPHRVFPGRLSVSRTFGDTEAKLARFGGNPNTIIAVPEIKAFRITMEHDFIVMASDGIFDKLSNRDVIQYAWRAIRESPYSDIHQVSGCAVEAVMRHALQRRTLDNVTVVLIGLPGLVCRAVTEAETEVGLLPK